MSQHRQVGFRSKTVFFLVAFIGCHGMFSPERERKDSRDTRVTCRSLQLLEGTTDDPIFTFEGATYEDVEKLKREASVTLPATLLINGLAKAATFVPPEGSSSFRYQVRNTELVRLRFPRARLPPGSAICFQSPGMPNPLAVLEVDWARASGFWSPTIGATGRIVVVRDQDSWAEDSVDNESLEIESVMSIFAVPKPPPGTSFVDANCVNPAGIDALQRSVAAVGSVSDYNVGLWCSGSLTQDTRGNRYFLTAFHCLGLSGGCPREGHFISVELFWDHETAACQTTPSIPPNNVLLDLPRSRQIELAYCDAAADLIAFSVGDLPADRTALKFSPRLPVNRVGHPFGLPHSYTKHHEVTQVRFDGACDGVEDEICLQRTGTEWVHSTIDQGRIAPGSSGSPFTNAELGIAGVLVSCCVKDGVRYAVDSPIPAFP